MAIETLQQNTLGTVKDYTVQGSGIVSAFEHLGLNLAGALGSIGIAKLAQSTGVSASTVSRGSTSLLTGPSPYAPGPLQVQQTNWMAFGVVALSVAAFASLIVFAARQRK